MLLKKGSTGHAVVELQEALERLGHELGLPDGHFGPKTKKAVKSFQSNNGLKADGLVGNLTYTMLNNILSQKGLELMGENAQDEQDLDEPEQKLKWVRCPADKFPGRSGYKRTTLREDCAVAYNELYREVHELGGILTSAGGRRSLASGAGPARSKKSMHYTGLAFDMALPTAMHKPDVDPYVIESIGDRRWRVWMRAEQGENMKLDASYVRRKGKKTQLLQKEVEGKFVDFTALALKHGFHSIRGRRSFFKGGSYGGAEWWHFQYEKALTRGVSKFGEELLKVYSLDRCKRFGILA